jgi:hypothetical protein
LLQLGEQSGPAVNSELRVDGVKVELDGPLGDAEAFGDLTVPKALGNGPHHFNLAAAQ